MAITTLAELKTAINSWMLSRDDIGTSDTVTDEFIDLAEADVNNGILLPDGSVVALRVREMESSSTLTPDSDGQATLPSDYLEYRAVLWTGSPRRDLKIIDPMMAEHRYGYREADTPSHFTIIGSTIQVLPVSTTDISLLYYASISALSDDNTSNWLLAKSPNAYLFGACQYAAMWLRDDKAAGMFQGRFLAEIMKLNAADKGQRYARAAVMSQGQKP